MPYLIKFPIVFQLIKLIKINHCNEMLLRVCQKDLHLSDIRPHATKSRQHAIEILQRPPDKENKELTWPNWPLKLRTSSSQAEGAARDFAVATSRFVGANGRLEQLECIRLDGQMKPMPGTEFQIPADLVLLAMGFLHPVQEGMVKDLRVALDARGNVKANDLDYRTSRPKVFAAGDMRRGQSLVVWAIREGRQAAHAIDKFLMGKTELPR